MKTIFKERVEKTIYYVCDWCGKEYDCEEDALDHEEFHACQHNYELWFTCRNDGGGEYTLNVESRCEKCEWPNPEIDRFLNIKLQNIPQHLIKAIYEFFDKLRAKPKD